jgi:hypothetical protein
MYFAMGAPSTSGTQSTTSNSSTKSASTATTNNKSSTKTESNANTKTETATDNRGGSADAAVAANDDYIISDSNKRYVTEKEVQALSPWERFIARNEIYARHGRGFNDQRLKDYFGSKNWYSRRYSPEEFNDNVLNSYEKKNANFIRSIEEQAGSPYVS